MAYQNPELPWWFEAYQDSTVLVACVSNYDSIYKSKSEAQLFFLHQLVQQLDAVILKSDAKLWRMHAFSLPLYCVLCPQCNSSNHANVVFEVALELAAAASKVNLPCGDPVDLRVGLASGRSSAGVIGATGVTFVVTGKIAQGAKHFAERTAYLTASEETWRKLSPANRSRGHWCRSSLASVPTVGSLPCLDYHTRNPSPRPPTAPAKAPAPPTITPYTLDDITAEAAILHSHPLTPLPWSPFRHPGIEAAYRQWLVRELSGFEHAVLLLSALVMLSSQFRVVAAGLYPVALARCALAAVPIVAIFFPNTLQRCGLLLHEGAWVAMLATRKALLVQPGLVAAPPAAVPLHSPLMPYLADLLDCLVGLAVFKGRFAVQALGGLLCWVASLAWSLLQLQAGSVDGGGFLSAWLVGSASLLLQAWVLVRWERHKRRTFLRLLHQRSSSSSSSSCKPSSNCAGEEAASEGVADAPVACCCFGAAAQAAAKLP